MPRAVNRINTVLSNYWPGVQWWVSSIGFFNPVVPTQNFIPSRNPDGYFWHSTFRVLLSRLSRPFALKSRIPSFTWRKSQIPKNLLRPLSAQDSWILAVSFCMGADKVEVYKKADRYLAINWTHHNWCYGFPGRWLLGPFATIPCRLLRALKQRWTKQTRPRGSPIRSELCKRKSTLEKQ